MFDLLANLSATAQLVQWLNIAFLATGGAVGLGFCYRMMRSGRWREPLGENAAPFQPALTLDFFLLFFAVILLMIGAGELVGFLETRLGDRFPDWQQGVLGDVVIKCGGGALAAALLFSRGRQLDDSNRANAGFPWTFAILAFWIATPLVSVQLFAEETIWTWLDGEKLPQHTMLDPVLNGDAGAIGRLQLFVSAVIVTPIAEELVFRGVILGSLQRLFNSHWPAVAMQGILFGLMHAAQPQAVLPLATFGIILGYVAARTGSLPACILIHVLFNARTMVIAFLAPELI